MCGSLLAHHSISNGYIHNARCTGSSRPDARRGTQRSEQNGDIPQICIYSHVAFRKPKFILYIYRRHYWSAEVKRVVVVGVVGGSCHGQKQICIPHGHDLVRMYTTSKVHYQCK